MNKIYILIVNWNNWQDTLICLESVFRSDYADFKVIVCDNGSQDNSLLYIKAWAGGTLDAFISPKLQLRNHTFPPVQKQIKFKEYKRHEAERGGDLEEKDPGLILIQNDVNLGFAGGNNVGLRYAVARSDFDYIWLLNNDTIVKPDSLSHLVKKSETDSNVGICGSTLLYYDNTDMVQAYGGGTYNKWLGFSGHLGLLKNIGEYINSERIESRMDYVVGASMLVSNKFLRDIGMMSEEYFFYFEDIDWAARAKSRYRLAYAPASIVYHKEGESSGAGNNPDQKSLLSDFYFIRSRLLFTRKFFPYALPTVYIGLLVTIFNRITRRQYDRVGMVIKLLFNAGKHDKYNDKSVRQ
jgi:GT2 family glycosyltransferase